MSSGILYIARGDYVKEAIRSAHQLKSVNSAINIALITDQDIDEKVFDRIIKENLRTDVSNKVFNLQKTPYDRTLFLDTDIYVEKDISHLFHLLNEFDIGISINQVRDIDNKQYEGFPEFNSGVIVYKKNQEFLRFCQRWRELYTSEMREEIIADQPSFRKALFESDLRISPLSREYNCRFGHPGQLSGEVKIFHGRILDISSTGLSKKYSIDRVVNKLNNSSLPRVYLPKSRGIKLLIKRKPYRKQLVDSIREYGVKGTVRRIRKKLLNHF